MAQFSSSSAPQSAIAYKGNAPINGYPAGPKDSYMTLGGFYDPNDVNNGAQLTIPFGTITSAQSATADQWVTGRPSGYLLRGVAIADNAIMYNEPFHSTSYPIGLPATVMIRGFFRLSSWTTTAPGALAIPYPGVVPIYSTASGIIEFLASGTSSAPVGWNLVKDAFGQQALAVVDLDPLLGSTSAGGLLLYINAY